MALASMGMMGRGMMGFRPEIMASETQKWFLANLAIQ